MKSRKKIKAEIDDDIEILKSGRWYVAIGTYNDKELAMQGESKQEAIDNLATKFYYNEKRKKDREKRQDKFKNEMECRTEIIRKRYRGL